MIRLRVIPTTDEDGSVLAGHGYKIMVEKPTILTVWIVALLTILLTVLLFAFDAKAQTTPGSGSNITLPETGPQSSTSAGQTCVQAKIGGEPPPPYSCLNQQLQQEVQGTNGANPSLPLTATSPSNKVGTFNQQSVEEQYGSNYGKSVIPYRPPAPVYGGGLHP